MAFDKTIRNRLQKFVSQARGILTEEFTRQLQSIYGLDPKNGIVTAISALSHLDNVQRQTAQILRETLAYYSVNTHGKTTAECNRLALDRIVREQSFTVLNRLAALRMAESRGFLYESICKGYRSKGFQLYKQIAGSSLGETGDAYRCYLYSIFDEFSLGLSVLFDRNSKQGLLFPRESALQQLLEEIDHPEIEPLWAEDETIGWIYQYYNDPDERKKLRKESAAPRNSRELAVRNQFFTPRYVVEFLTDNTLGRIWYEMTHGQTHLAQQCRYLVRRPTEIFLAEGETAPEAPDPEGLSQEELLKQPVYIPQRPLKDPREIRLLDPACGSMHFGLYAFDLFETIYEEAWDNGSCLDLQNAYTTRDEFLKDIPRLIIEYNIHGIDIDTRAVQIAGLSLWLRAQKAWQARGNKPADRPRVRRSNIVCAEPMPGSTEMLEDFVATLKPPLLGELVKIVFDKMQLAGEAGSLLKIEEEIRTAIDTARKEWLKQQRDLFSSMNGSQEEFFDTAEQQVIDSLRVYAEKADADSYQRRLFADDAARGFAFIDLCRKRYDAVVMNPPFGEWTSKLKTRAKKMFPESYNDILHAFVERGIASLNREGRLGVISARTGFFLGDSKNWRSKVVFENRLVCFADLGLGVLDDALVEVASYIVEKSSTQNTVTLTDRQLDTRDKDAGLLRSIEATKVGEPGGLRPFEQDLLEIIPDYTFAYWAPGSFLRRYRTIKSFKDSIGPVRQGVATASDFRFVRLGWEVKSFSIGRTVRWQRFSKGGEYSPPYDDIHLLVDWKRDGAQIKQYVCQQYPYLNGNWSFVVKNSDSYFLPGATYTVRTASAFAGKVLPKDCIFSHNAQCWFPESPDVIMFSIAYMSCRVPQAFIELAVGGGDIATSGSAARRYTTAVIESVPAGVISSIMSDETVAIAKRLFRHRLADFLVDESSCHFISLHLDSTVTTLADACAALLEQKQVNTVDAIADSEKLDSAVMAAFLLSEEEIEFVENEIGPHPASYTGTLASEAVAPLIELSETELIARAIENEGSKRWYTKKSFFVDRRIELLCHFLKVGPRTLVECFTRSVPKASLIDHVAMAVSECVGTAFGRWDIRYATGERQPPELPDPFDPLPVCPPGMLQNAEGLPAESKDVAADYPLRISWPGILVDDENHPEDIVARVREAIEVIWKDRAEAIEQEACELLGVKTLRDYFRRPTAFFADHLKRYSKSRRQAPIYWPLQTPSGSYTLWIYYHRLDEQTLYTCVNNFVEPKLTIVSNHLNSIRNKPTRSGSEEKEMVQLTDLEAELQEFRDELLRLAKFWKPNLNDGVQITAAPLWKLFQFKQWQKKLKETWAQLEKGDYDWAHLAYSIWPERVLRKCHEDHSLAIAHDVECDIWEEIEVPSRNDEIKSEWQPKKLSETQMRELMRQIIAEAK